MGSTLPLTWPARRQASHPDRVSIGHRVDFAPRRADLAVSDDPGFGRVVGLDLGSKRIGVAVCDAGRMVATPYETVRRVGDRPVEHQRITEIVAETEAVLLLVGLPLSLDGSVGQAAKTVLSEVRALRRTLTVPVETHDERLTTVTADDYLSQQRVRGNKRRDVVDQVAAAVILQSWIDGGGAGTTGGDIGSDIARDVGSDIGWGDNRPADPDTTI